MNQFSRSNDRNRNSHMESIHPIQTFQIGLAGRNTITHQVMSRNLGNCIYFPIQGKVVRTMVRSNPFPYRYWLKSSPYNECRESMSQVAGTWTQKCMVKEQTDRQVQVDRETDKLMDLSDTFLDVTYSRTSLIYRDPQMAWEIINSKTIKISTVSSSYD